MQNPLQILVSYIATREEVIFLIRLISHQMHEVNRDRIGNLKLIQDEILRGEYKREHLENQLLAQVKESQKKLFLPKIISKSHKIATFFMNKTQTYFPKQGQQICQEALNQPNLRSTIQQMSNENIQHILRFIINQQRYKLKQELNRISQVEREDRTNRNEKFFTEDLVVGVNGIRYLNELHKKFCYNQTINVKKNVYDILQIDDSSKSLLMNGGGFRPFVSAMCGGKDNQKNDPQQSVYIPVESTIEIITQRYEKLMKDLMDQNVHVRKSLQRFADHYQRRSQRSSIIRQNHTSPISLKITTHKISLPHQERKSEIFQQLSGRNIIKCKKQPLKCKTLKEDDESLHQLSQVLTFHKLSSPLVQSLPIRNFRIFDANYIKFDQSRLTTSRKSRYRFEK